MAWNQPGNNGQDRDPWGSGNKNNGSNPNGNNQGGRNQGPSVDDLFRKLNNMLGKMGGGNQGNNSNNNSNMPKSAGVSKVISLGLIVAAIIWGGSGFYTVQEGRVGVITRFGQVQDNFVTSGLHWKPTFIDRVIEVDQQGNRDFKTNGVMLTSDENVVNVEMSVVYQVENPINFLFNVTNAENSLRQASDSALRSTIGKHPMERILTDGKAQIGSETQKELVSIINNYNMGLRVIAVNLENARPPEEVKKAFDDAISAREDEQKTILEAQRYANRVIPEAQGDAAIIIANAKAYKERVVREAEGEVDQFVRLLPEYKAAPDVTRARLYINTMEKIMSKTGKILIDGSNSNNLMVLPLDKIANNGNVSGSALTDALTSAISNSSNTTSATNNSNTGSTNTVTQSRTQTVQDDNAYAARTDTVRRGRQL